MGKAYQVTWKRCATCNFWGGQRDVDQFGIYATVNSEAEKGKCLCFGGPWKDHLKRANEDCNKWQKWVGLR